MKKKLVVALVVTIMVVSSVIGGTYAWFFSQGAIVGNGKAAKIDLYHCKAETISFENVLPGESIKLDSNAIWYEGTRHAIVQFKLTGNGILQAGAENHSDWKALSPSIIAQDYRLKPDGRYEYTEKRMNEILALVDTHYYEDFGSRSLYLYPSLSQPNTYYAYLPATTPTGLYNFALMVILKFNGEFGGMYKGSPSRQFEQSSKFESVGLRLTAVQVTKEAILDVLGDYALIDVQDMADNGVFPIPEEWEYVG